MRILWATLALLALCGTTQGAPAKPKESRGSKIALKAAPPAPYRADGVWRGVTETLGIGGASFATRVESKLLLVAESPGGEPTRKVRSGTTVKLTWPVGEKKASGKFRFVRSEDGAWRYYAAEAMRFKLGRAAIALVDADADGIIGEFGVDGVLLGSTAHAIPLHREMLIGLQNVTFASIEPDGSSMKTSREAVKGGRAQLQTLAFLNYLRRAHGLSPVVLDKELSRGCTEHAEYLTANAWNGSSDPHDQDKSRKGATDDGAAAAGVSVIMKMPAIASLRTHYVTYYHRLGLMHPRLASIGINETIPTLTVIDVYRGRLKGEAGAAIHMRPRFCPADGVVGLPPGSHGEQPREPVPDLASRGFPLMVWFPEAGGPITEFKAELFTGKRGRTKVAGLLVEPDAKGVAGLVPKRRLDGKTRYQAHFSWTRGGKPHSKIIRFRTH